MEGILGRDCRKRFGVGDNDKIVYRLDDFPHCEYVTPEMIPQYINPPDLRLTFFNCRGFLSSAEYLSSVIPVSGVDVFRDCETFLT